MEHKWLLAHGDALCEKHPKLRRNSATFRIALTSNR